MLAYLEAPSPYFRAMASTRYDSPLTTEQVKWNAHAKNVIFEAIGEQNFNQIHSQDLAHDICQELINLNEQGHHHHS